MRRTRVYGTLNFLVDSKGINRKIVVESGLKWTEVKSRWSDGDLSRSVGCQALKTADKPPQTRSRPRLLTFLS